eukprot:3274219-Prymnesium_polylepis.1
MPRCRAGRVRVGVWGGRHLPPQLARDSEHDEAGEGEEGEVVYERHVEADLGHARCPAIERHTWRWA